MIKRAGGPSGGSLLHLVRDDAEASLCGIPRASLGTGGVFDEVILPRLHRVAAAANGRVEEDATHRSELRQDLTH